MRVWPAENYYGDPCILIKTRGARWPVVLFVPEAERCLRMLPAAIERAASGRQLWEPPEGTTYHNEGRMFVRPRALRDRGRVYVGIIGSCMGDDYFTVRQARVLLRHLPTAIAAAKAERTRGAA